VAVVVAKKILQCKDKRGLVVVVAESLKLLPRESAMREGGNEGSGRSLS
jgi:hypothetical protein